MSSSAASVTRFELPIQLLFRLLPTLLWCIGVFSFDGSFLFFWRFVQSFLRLSGFFLAIRQMPSPLPRREGVWLSQFVTIVLDGCATFIVARHLDSFRQLSFAKQNRRTFSFLVFSYCKLYDFVLIWTKEFSFQKL